MVVACDVADIAVEVVGDGEDGVLGLDGVGRCCVEVLAGLD